jgi:hypothetical protein
MRITTLALSAAMVLGGLGAAGMAQAAPEARPTVRPAGPLQGARPKLQAQRQHGLQLQAALARPATEGPEARPAHRGARGERMKMAQRDGERRGKAKGKGRGMKRGHGKKGHGKAKGSMAKRGAGRGGGC